MEIGVITVLRGAGRNFGHVQQFGLNVCQLFCGDRQMATPEMAAAVRQESAETGVRVCAVWAGLPGPAEWNFTGGPVTLGLVPPAYRQERVAVLKQWADFAAWLGVPAIITHCGFIPENLTDPEFPPVVEAIREVAEHCAAQGIGFWFETGQETPVVLLRVIQKVGTGNLGINLDPANLILYGKGNPIDALDVIGPYVRNIHVKDGFYPTDGERLGREVPVGEGRVRFPEFLRRLREIGFDGELIIEREITGDAQARDIRQAVENLRVWLAA
jgi:sugar phosphate isomerase/epimerase